MIKQLVNKSTGEVFDTDAHQVAAYNHLVKNKRAALFLEMSLSKTVIALSYLYDMHYCEAAFTKTLVISTANVIGITWPNEINKWAHLDGIRYSVIAGDEKARLKALHSDAEIYLVSKDNLVWLVGQFITKRNGRYTGKLPFDSLVIDESSLFKNRQSERFKALARAIKTIDYRIIMTGTPVTNGYINLWAQMFILDDGVRLYPTFGRYVDEYFKTRGNGQIIYEYTPRPGAIQLINRVISDIAITMKTREYIKMADFHTHDEVITLGRRDMELYNTLERDYVLELAQADVTVKTAADLGNKLLQISGGAIYHEDGKNWDEVNTAKLDACEDIIYSYEGNFIVTYIYKHECERLAARFPEAVIFGSGPKAKDIEARWNKGEIKILLLHPASGGHGLNLQFGGRRMIWYTPTHDLDLYNQTIARIDRRGVTEAGHLHRLIVKGTRDSTVYKKIAKKDSVQNILFSEVKDLRAKHLF